ncbi:MAG TPA: hypothetical protein PK990_05095, partial [Salinivirgaceae bacterium]|nr:hypothetical protein [Salinivirgaceae bacterium]
MKPEFNFQDKPDFPSTEVEQQYQRLIEKCREKMSSEELRLVEEAYAMASNLLKERYRQSGEPYIVHP